MQLLADPEQAIETYQEDLRVEGFPEARIQDLQRGTCDNVFRNMTREIPGDLQQLLDRLPALALRYKQQDLSGEDVQRIRQVLEKQFLTDPWRLSAGSVSKLLLRARSLLLLWMDKQELRDALVRQMREYIRRGTLGPLGDFSQFAALHFHDLRTLYSGDDELSWCLETAITAHRRWPAVYATTPDGAVPHPASPNRVPRAEDDVVERSGIRTVMTAQKPRFTTCSDSEYAHMVTSLSDERGQNTYVFVQDVLVGSLKHGSSNYASQETFLGMRTVRRPADGQHGGRFDGTYPVVEGALYQVGTHEDLHAIRASGDIAHLDRLSLMPVRAMNGFNLVPEAAYLDRIRIVRTRVERRS